MASNITSSAVFIGFYDNVCIQLVWTSTPVGTFALQACNDVLGANIVPGNSNNWTAVTLSPSPAAAGAAGTWLLDMQEVSFPWIRIVYTAGSSSGLLGITVSAKAVG